MTQRHIDKSHSQQQQVNNNNNSSSPASSSASTLKPIRNDKIQAKVLDLSGSQNIVVGNTTNQLIGASTSSTLLNQPKTTFNLISVNTSSPSELMSTNATINATSGQLQTGTGTGQLQTFSLVNFANYSPSGAAAAAIWPNNVNINMVNGGTTTAGHMTNSISPVSGHSPMHQTGGPGGLFISAQQLQHLQQHQQQQQHQIQPKQVIISNLIGGGVGAGGAGNQSGNDLTGNNTTSTYFLS